jgi:hypothetical protein
MEHAKSRFIGGMLLIVGGLFLLLQTLGLVTFQWLGSLFGFLLFAAAGIGFMLFFLTRHEHWWAIIPGCVFFSLAVLVGLDSVAPRLSALWGGSIFLGGISLAFWLIYLIQRQYWWALIPGGVLLTLAAVAGLDQLAPAWDTGSIFFLGLAATFVLVYLAPTAKERMSWALIPAAVFLVLAIVVWGALTALLNYLVPLALIVIGLFLIWRNYTAGEKWPVKSDK